MKINDLQVLGLDADTESSFQYSGCENCGNGLGNDVYVCQAWMEDKTLIEVELCHTCTCAYYNGDEIDDNCENLYEI